MPLVGKDGETCETMKMGHSKSFWTTLVEMIGKKKQNDQIGVVNHFIPLWWEKIGKSVQWPKLGILNYFGPLW